MTDSPEPDTAEAFLARTLPPYYTAIGEIAVIWAEIEHRLDQLIWDLADVEQTLGACITSQLNGPTVRFRVIKTLLNLRGWPPETQTKINKLGHEIQAVQEARNRAVHDVTLVGTASEKVFKRTVATIQNKLVFETVEQSLFVLTLVAVESREILQKFNSINDAIRSSEPVPSPGKLRELLYRQGRPSEHRLSLNPTRQTHSHPPRSSPP